MSTSTTTTTTRPQARIVGAAAQHMARRFTAGMTEATGRQIRVAKGPRRWFDKQLNHLARADRPGQMVDGWFDFHQRTPEQIFDRQNDDVEGVWEVMADLSRWTMSRRMLSNRQVHEQLVDFWSNLLNVPLSHDEAGFFRVDYDQVIRRYALDSFENLLLNTITHPAMGLYLGNAVSTKDAPNENLGRELLELHTVGLGHYTEADVKASSRMLTGYRVDIWWPSFRAFYDPKVHDTQPVTVMGFTHANSERDGQEATRAYLRYLAQHPATAARIARRLCVRFVSDAPSSGLVDTVAAAYRANRSQIRPVLKALVSHPEFKSSANAKVRTPTEDYLAAVRALRIVPAEPTRDDSFVNGMYWQYSDLGNPPYEWPAPNGYPEVGAAWTSAGRILNGATMHSTLAGAWWPRRDATFFPQGDWLPDFPATTEQVIDTVCERLLFTRPTDAVRRGIATDLGLPLSRVLKRGDMWNQRIEAVVASLLDSPLHLRR